MSDKALIQGVGSVMVRDRPRPFLFAPYCLKGCQQLSLMPSCWGRTAFLLGTEVWRKVRKCFCSPRAAG